MNSKKVVPSVLFKSRETLHNLIPGVMMSLCGCGLLEHTLKLYTSMCNRSSRYSLIPISEPVSTEFCPQPSDWAVDSEPLLVLDLVCRLQTQVPPSSHDSLQHNIWTQINTERDSTYTGTKANFILFQEYEPAHAKRQLMYTQRRIL